MNRNDILDLYRYNDWANARVIAVLQQIPNEALHRDLGGSFRSIRDVLAHIVSAEWIWLERWTGNNPQAIPEWVATGSVPDLIDRLHSTENARRTFLEELPPSDLDRDLTIRYISGRQDTQRLSVFLMHAANHSTYHRGQLAHMLRQTGNVPPSTDYVVYKAAQ